MIQHALEHLRSSGAEARLFSLRLGLCISLLAGAFPEIILLMLLVHGLVVLWWFRGPYNGGSDKLGLLMLVCLCGAHWLANPVWRELALGYLAVQLVLSYFISGQVKILRAAWRSGQALGDVFRFSAYPASEDLRGLARHPQLMWAGAWIVMGFELLFPLAVLHQGVLYCALAAAFLFHLANACLFGLNRFLWIWPAAFPALIWLQDRLF
jgi:hypothetical protein